MNILKRTKMENSVSENQKPRRFIRNQSKKPVEELYTQGVRLIIKNRKILGLKNDTIFLSVDIFKSHLNKVSFISKNTLLPLCIASILVASKLNQVYPPKIDDIIEALQYFDDKKQLIKFEAMMLRQCNFEIPFSNNIISRLEQNGIVDQQQVEQYQRIIYRCLSDPYLLRVQNEIISKALTFLIEGKEKQNISNKSVGAVLSWMKKKSQTPNLTEHSLNIKN